MAKSGLTLRLLGPLRIERGGVPIELPPSKKARALLGYLATTGREHHRQQLSDLLWDVADDPRGGLRWCLSKLRALIDEPGRARVLTEAVGRLNGEPERALPFARDLVRLLWYDDRGNGLSPCSG